eukprot:4876150-Amphidinium_carterae.1
MMHGEGSSSASPSLVSGFSTADVSASIGAWEERSTSASQSDHATLLASQQYGFEDLVPVGPDLGAGSSGK